MRNVTNVPTGGTVTISEDGAMIFLPALWAYVGDDREITAEEGKLLEIGGAGTIVCTGKPVFISPRSYIVPVDREVN